jgi:hypothetical protein
VAEEEEVVMRLILMFVVALSSTALAQPAPQRPAAPAQIDARDKIKQRIRALRAYTLTEELALDEATAAKLFPALAKFDEEFDKLLAARIDIARRLEGARDIKDPRAIDRLIDEAVANQRALWDTEAKRLTELRKILTPAQTARVIVVLPRMERKIQNQLRRAVQRAQRRGQPADPYEDEDDDVLPPARPGRRMKPAPAAPR